jgi:hypothetical protein
VILGTNLLSDDATKECGEGRQLRLRQIGHVCYHVGVHLFDLQSALHLPDIVLLKFKRQTNATNPLERSREGLSQFHTLRGGGG